MQKYLSTEWFTVSTRRSKNYSITLWKAYGFLGPLPHHSNYTISASLKALFPRRKHFYWKRTPYATS